MRPFSLGTLVKTSRPRFWPYLLGPFLVGFTGGSHGVFAPPPFAWLVVAWTLWLTLPANLIIYGINDLYDEETDAVNEKKAGYETRIESETRPQLKKAIALSALLGCALFVASAIALFERSFAWVGVGLIGFLFFGHQYSATPIRAKARPFLDSAFNVLYVFPAFIGWGLSHDLGTFPWLLALAGTCWCMSMHAFSAIPDIDADRKARLSTVATQLGKEKTLALCAVLYTAACLLTIPWLGAFSAVGFIAYLGMMLRAWYARKDAHRFFLIYTQFSPLNIMIGFFLWLFILLR